MKANTLFQRRGVLCACAVFCTWLWGSAFPCIKTGYRLFGIAAGDTGSQMLFAGSRFFLAGLLTLGASLIFEKRNGKEKITAGGIRGIVLLGFIQTFLQYVFYYIGMAHVTGVKGAVMNGASAFFCVITSACFYRESLSGSRIPGCILGLAGVIIVNLGKGGLGGGFSLLGEGFMLISAVCVALGALVSKEVSQNKKPLALCGWQLCCGGGLLIAAGLFQGGGLSWREAGPQGFLLLGYMVFLSAAAFGVWTVLLKYNPMGRVTVFNFLIPVFGTILSALFLGESVWEPHILCSLPLVCLGIYLVNRE